MEALVLTLLKRALCDKIFFLFFFFQHTMLQLIKEAGCHNGLTPRDDSPVTEVLNQVCPSTWRGACKTAVQLLFGQAGLVSNYR